MNTTQNAKAFAAEKAVSLIESGMKLGLGTGSTAKIAIDLLGKRVAEGLRIVGIPTSQRSAEQALALGIPLTNFEETPRLDLTIDGADQVLPGSLQLIKGLGGALLREKIVAFASDRYLIVVDESKIVSELGGKVPVPVEVVEFGWNTTVERLTKIGARPVPRRDAAGALYRTDTGNLIADCFFEQIKDAGRLEIEIKSIVGVVECGLFLGLKPEVIVGTLAGARIL
jgi:ribose 5-phosphate isomerase A